ncbi:hypothetical protein F5I97DRAFT_1815300 [Phlebopus sp. FC_14]|nr:hypothetical protein F5I97DRAFT_1815300 [Phlebopus sp. FC_14]
MNETIKATRSDDAARLRDKMTYYAAPNPSVVGISPPIPSGSSKTQMGFNHVFLASLLCPIESVSSFISDPPGTLARLQSGQIEVTAQEFPAFLWEDNGKNYNPENMFDGLFRGYLLERVGQNFIEDDYANTRSGYTGPSTSLAEGSRSTRACNADLHQMDTIEPAHIAYACVQVSNIFRAQPATDVCDIIIGTSRN